MKCIASIVKKASCAAMPYGMRGRGVNLSAGAVFGLTFFLTLVSLGLVLASPALAQNPPLVVALGDSLTAGFGLNPGQSVPDQLAGILRGRGFRLQMQNAGVSGDTTSGGLRRLDWVLAGKPDIVMVALGANDAMRGYNPSITRANLDAILTKLRARNVKILLIGMQSPANFGLGFVDDFNRIFSDLARKHGTPLYPFMLEGVALRPALNQPDGIHPNSAGAALIAQKLAPMLADLLESLQTPVRSH